MEIESSSTLSTYAMPPFDLEKSDEAESLLHVIVSNFKPLHFVSTMGIGITAGIMYEFPIISIRRGMKYVGLVYFFINLVTFIITHVLFILKYLVFPSIYKNDPRYKVTFFKLLHTPVTVFLGCSVMGGTTLVNMLYFMKPTWWIALYTLWTINYISAFLTACGAGFFLLTTATHMKPDQLIEAFSQLTPAYFLPFVTCTVSAASGALISNSIPHPHLVLANVIIGVMLWSMALAISIFLFAVFLTRLLVVGIPKGPAAFTVFIPLGVLGQGSFGIMLLCSHLGKLIVNQNFSIIGFPNLDIETKYLQIFSNGCNLFGVFSSLVLAGFGVLFTFWAIFSVCYWYIGWPNIPLSTTNYHAENISEDDIYITVNGRKFCLWTPTMWACTFPMGTLALAFNELWNLTSINGFKIMATIYAFTVILTTTYCMIFTLLFVVPWKAIHKAISY